MNFTQFALLAILALVAVVELVQAGQTLEDCPGFSYTRKRTLEDCQSCCVGAGYYYRAGEIYRKYGADHCRCMGPYYRPEQKTDSD